MSIYYIVMSGFEPRTLTQPDIMMLNLTFAQLKHCPTNDL